MAPRPHPTPCVSAGPDVTTLLYLSLFYKNPLFLWSKSGYTKKAILIQSHKITAKTPPPPHKSQPPDKKRRGATAPLQIPKTPRNPSCFASKPSPPPRLFGSVCTKTSSAYLVPSHDYPAHTPYPRVCRPAPYLSAARSRPHPSGNRPAAA